MLEVQEDLFDCKLISWRNLGIARFVIPETLEKSGPNLLSYQGISLEIL